VARDCAESLNAAQDQAQTPIASEWFGCALSIDCTWLVKGDRGWRLALRLQWLSSNIALPNRKTTMNNTELLVRLRELHEELSAINTDQEPVNQVDDETIDALGQLVSDASELVDKVKASSEGRSPDKEKEPLETEHNYLADRIMEFDQAHPRVREFLTQMTDLLAMMGI
jgi:hypothetical protein